MNIADGWLLLKKVMVGVAITVVPLIIIAGGLWSIQQARSSQARTRSQESAKVTYAN